jgi:hypothetical protein
LVKGIKNSTFSEGSYSIMIKTSTICKSMKE